MTLEAAPLLSEEPSVEILDALEALAEPGFASLLAVGSATLAMFRRRDARPAPLL